LVNNICYHLEKQISLLRENLKPIVLSENTRLLKDLDILFDKEKYKILYTLYKKYKNQKRIFKNIFNEKGEQKYTTIEQFNKYIREEALSISDNISELANLSVSICYETHPSDNKEFAWAVFGEGIIDNIIKNRQEKIKIPFIDDNGSIEYLGTKYSLCEINIEGEDEWEKYLTNIDML
jgi:hypothetical protein